MVMIEYALRNAQENIPQRARISPMAKTDSSGKLIEQRGLARRLGLFGTTMKARSVSRYSVIPCNRRGS
jgi:hypothetical protein